MDFKTYRVNRNNSWIVIEGIAGTGKSTFALRLKEEAERRGYNVMLTGEPTSNSPFGEYARNSTPDETAELFFMADRVQHIFGEVIPFLNGATDHDKRLVIQVRYWPSTVAYQGHSLKDFYRIFDLNCEKFPKPDVFLFLTDSAERCLDRVKKREKNEEKEDAENWDYINSVVIKKVEKRYRMLIDYLPFKEDRLSGTKVIEVDLEALDRVVDEETLDGKMDGLFWLVAKALTQRATFSRYMSDFYFSEEFAELEDFGKKHKLEERWEECLK